MLELNKKIIVIPHWRKGGGAGFYILNLIDALKPNAEVWVGGQFGSDYDSSPISSKFLDKLGALSLPAYNGVRPSATLFHFVMSLGRILALCLVPKRNRLKDAPAAFIFTSSIQVLSVPIVKWFYPSSRVAIVVQEQVELSSLFGKLISKYLRQSDIVLAITDGWATYARKFGIECLVVQNQYDLDYAAPEKNQTPAINSELLFVGGGGED